MAKATLIKENISLEPASWFRGSVHYHHGRKHGTVQADVVLEEPRVLILIQRQPGEDCLPQEEALIPHWAELESRSPQSSSTP